MMSGKDIYRRVASIVVLRPATDGSFELLLLHKPRKNDDWQVPQGGIEHGETTEQAALRELSEEAGVTTATVTGRSEKVYQYDFPPSYRRFRPDNVCGQHIEYVFATVPADTVVTVDNKEIDGYLWVTIDQVSQHVKRKQYLELVQELYQEAVKSLS